MSFEQIFDESYERVVVQELDGCDFFQAFYRRFLEMSEEIAERFQNTDMDHQRAMLKKSFYSLLAFYASSNADHYLQQIARSHSRSQLAIRPEFYDFWLEALIDTARSFDPGFCSRTELAWRLVMAPGLVYMKFHFDNDVD